MKQLLLENIGVLLTTLATGFGAWFFGRKKAKADAEAAHIANEASQIENAGKFLVYYQKIFDDMEGKLDLAIENLKKSEIEKQEVIKKFTEATETIHELERKVVSLTDELRKYKQLNGKV